MIKDRNFKVKLIITQLKDAANNNVGFTISQPDLLLEHLEDLQQQVNNLNCELNRNKRILSNMEHYVMHYREESKNFDSDKALRIINDL